MTRRTSELRKLWAPACRRALQIVTLHSGAKITITKECVEAFKAIDTIMQSFRYAPRKADTGAFNCRKITGAWRCSGGAATTRATRTRCTTRWWRRPRS